MTEKYYSIIYPRREYIIEEETKYVFKINKGTLSIYTTFGNEIYPVIKKCCIRYEPQEFFFILGWFAYCEAKRLGLRCKTAAFRF